MAHTSGLTLCSGAVGFEDAAWQILCMRHNAPLKETRADAPCAMRLPNDTFCKPEPNHEIKRKTMKRLLRTSIPGLCQGKVERNFPDRAYDATALQKIVAHVQKMVCKIQARAV